MGNRKTQKKPVGPVKLVIILLKNASILALRKISGGKRGPKDFPKRFRKTLEDLGPTYIKLGQMLSSRYDLFSKETIAELSKLQDEVHPLPFEVIWRELQRTYGDPNDIFSSIKRKPIASASISQVHIGTLKDGRKVAIKIRRPFLREQVERDFITLRRLAKFIDRFVPLIHDDVTALVDEFGFTIEDEMDFLSEAGAMERFNEYFKDSRIVFSPDPINDYCTENVLVMEYIKGLKLSKIISDEYNSEKYPVRKDNLIETISGSLMDQMFIHGMLHADPHPGNFIITEDGKLFFIDFGRVNHLDYELQTFLLEYMISLAKRDSEMITEIISENFGLRKRDTYADDIRFIFTKYYGRTLGRMDMGELMVDSFNISRKHRVRLPAQVFLMSRIIVLIEGIGSRLDPDFSYVNFLKDYFSRRTMIDVVKERMTEMRRESVWNMVMLPRKLKSVERLVTGNKKINIKLPKIERLLDKFNHSLNALAVAVIMAGLLISVNKFQYPLIPQIVLMILGVYIIYQLMFKNK